VGRITYLRPGRRERMTKGGEIDIGFNPGPTGEHPLFCLKRKKKEVRGKALIQLNSFWGKNFSVLSFSKGGKRV